MLDNHSTKIYAAIVQHSRWKVRLKNTITTGSVWEGYDPSPEHCEFGRWLADNRIDLQMITLQEHYQSVNELHRAFHQAAKGVVDLVLTGKTEDAEASLNYGGQFDRASQDLVKAVINWHDALTQPACSSL